MMKKKKKKMVKEMKRKRATATRVWTMARPGGSFQVATSIHLGPRLQPVARHLSSWSSWIALLTSSHRVRSTDEEAS